MGPQAWDGIGWARASGYYSEALPDYCGSAPAARASRFSASTARAPQQRLHRPADAGGDPGQERVVERVRRVRGPVVVRVAVERGVGDHDPRLAPVPERGVVTQPGFR